MKWGQQAPAVNLRRMRRPPAHPGEVFEEEFRKFTVYSQAGAARAMGIAVMDLNQIVQGKRRVTPEKAVIFEAFTGVPAEFWMNLQKAWDLWHAYRDMDVSKVKRAEMKNTTSGRSSKRMYTKGN